MGINAGGGGPYADNDDSQTFRRFGTQQSQNDSTLSCPPGHYVSVLNGRSGTAVDQLNSVGCRNIINGNFVNGSGNGIGASTGGSQNQVTGNGTDGITGFFIRAETEMEHLHAEYRAANPKSCCGAATYEAGVALGPASGGWGEFHCDNNHLVQSISGGASSANKRVTNLSFNCRNFSNMARIGNNPTDCCLGKDTSKDCADVSQYLSCPSVVAAYCSQGNNIFTDASCLAAMANPTALNGLTPAVAANLKLKTCAAGNNYASDFCADFCTAKTGQNIPIQNTNTDVLIAGDNIKDGCNALYSLKCSMNNTPSVCGCQRDFYSYTGASDIPNKAEFVKDPACYFEACRNFGYFAKPLSEHGCPQCVQYQQLNATGSNIALSQILQQCNVNGTTGTSAGTTSAPTATATAAATPTTTSAATSNNTRNLVIGLIVFVVFILFAGCVGLIMSSAGGGN